MAINNRTVTIKNVFASTAETNIPNPPVPGQSYRNTSLTSEEVGQGWPFKEIVDSAKFNEAMYEYTTICQQLEKYGFLPWSANTDYPAGGCALGTDGNVYQAKQPTGPSTTSVDPVTDTSHTYWDLFYYGNVTANRALVSNSNGKVSASSTTATEIGYVHGVTSAIQTQINNKANNDSVVHKTGDETISGTKTFQGTGYITQIKNTSVTYNTAPASNSFTTIAFVDKNNTGMGVVEVLRETDNTTTVLLNAYGANGAWSAQPLRLNVASNGTTTAYAPPPTDTTSTSSHQIATVGWLNSTNNNVVHKTGNETISGYKYFTSNLIRAHTDLTKGTNPSSPLYWGVELTDKNGAGPTNRLGLLETVLSTNGDVETYIAAYLNTNGSRDQTALKIVYTKSGNQYATAPASDVIDSIVTTKAIRKTAQSGDNASWAIKLGNEFIIQGGSIESNISTVTLAIPFAKESYQVSMVQADDSEHNVNPTLSNKTVTNFKCGHHGWRVSWIAAGF